MDDLLQEFVAETRETLEALSGEIVAWESDPGDRARLDSIFRFVHTVKGSCGFLDLPRLARLSHAAEDALATVRNGERAADAGLVSAVLAIVDRIAELVEAIDSGEPWDDSDEDVLIGALTAPTEPGIVVSATPSPASSPRSSVRSVRMSIDLLDRMMGGVSDMVLARNELSRLIRESGSPELENAFTRLSATVGDLRETVTRTRMQRIEALFAPLHRLIRDTASSLGKQVVLTIDGADVELDREMIELLRDPLIHMVRNALDHGIEPAAERLAAAKPAAGHLRIAARQSGNRIMVEVADDGRGVDVAKVVEKAIAAEPERQAAIRAMSVQEQTALIFKAGVSSRDRVTDLSGRGVGMDVVHANVEQIGGRIILDNRPGRGLSITIDVPLTLSILPAIIVQVAGQGFAIPRQNVDEIVAAHSSAVSVARPGGAAMLTLRGRRLPLVDLATLLDLTSRVDGARKHVVVSISGNSFAITVDAVLDTEELVVKPAAPLVMAADIYAGQTLPDDGRPLLLLDCAGIARCAGLRLGEPSPAREEVEQDAAPPGVAMLLFVDLDGQQRVIALGAVDRIERMPLHRLAERSGGWYLATPDGSVPIIAAADPNAVSEITILRMSGVEGAVGYAIREALDVVELTDPIVATRAGGMVAGIVPVGGEQIEVIDPLLLLPNAQPATSTRPICLLDGAESDWMEAFLKPTIEAAGYVAVRRLMRGQVPAAILTMQDGPLNHDLPDASVVRLSARPGDGIYRGDRVAIVNAITKAHQ